MKRVIIESPYAGNRVSNIEYAKAAVRDSITRGEAPIAFHLLYPQILDDNLPRERQQGIFLSTIWYPCADLVAVYNDMGVSPGMFAGIDVAHKLSLPIEYRSIMSWSE